jgi:hypothetical protein
MAEVTMTLKRALIRVGPLTYLAVALLVAACNSGNGGGGGPGY